MKAKVLTLVAVANFILVSCDNSNQQHSHSGSSALTTEAGVWPPVLTSITNEAAYPTGLRNRARGSVLAAARESVLNNPQVRTELGSNYREYDSSPGDDKGDATASFLFFNYDINTTVEAVLQKTGSVTVTKFDASEFQPTENSAEVLDAISLGQADLATEGIDVSNLTGTAMLAHPADSANRDTMYYSERIMYVTFGQGGGVLPNYSALVNLSTNTVIESGLLQ